MKILLVTSHFHPENFKANDLAFELSRRGHEVTVLAPIPDYPQGKFYDGYGVFKRRTETVNGVRIIRSLIIPRHDGSAKWLALNYLSHTFFSCTRAIWLGLTKKFDTVIVHETSPVMVAIPGVLVKKMQRIPMHFWVLDLWPESLTAAGGINNRHILNIFGGLTKWLYKNSDNILICSKGFRNSINDKGDFDKKINYFPNWVDAGLTENTDYSIPELPKGFNVLFAGNIGDAQDMPHVLDAAKLLDGTGINIILVGDGRKKEWVESYIAEKHIRNVYVMGRYPLEAMSTFFSKADVLFLSLKNSPIFGLTVPAKLQSYMSSGKPIVAMINGEGASLINDADCGWSVPAEESEQLANLILEVSKKDKSILAEKGLNGKRYGDRYFRFETCIDNLEEFIEIKEKQ